MCFPPIADDVFHRAVFCKHWFCGGYEKWGNVFLVLVNSLFEEAPQVGGEIWVHQWLHEDRLAGLWWLQSSLPEDHFQCLLRGLFVDVGERLPAIRHSPKIPVVLVLLRSNVLTPSNRLLVLELRSHKSDHVLTCDVKV